MQFVIVAEQNIHGQVSARNGWPDGLRTDSLDNVNRPPGMVILSAL